MSFIYVWFLKTYLLAAADDLAFITRQHYGLALRPNRDSVLGLELTFLMRRTNRIKASAINSVNYRQVNRGNAAVAKIFLDYCVKAS